jgi:hypothetical protein
MNLEAFLWLFLPVFVAGGSALLSYYIMQARMEVALAKERESLAEARATIVSHKITLEERVKATEESSKRKALDDFMQDIRTEERSYVREFKSLEGSRKTMVMQERLFFRNIPLSNWIEHEMLVEEDRDLNRLPRESVFASAALPSTETTQIQVAQAQAAQIPAATFTEETPAAASISATQGAPETRVAITRLLSEVGPQRNAPNHMESQRDALLNMESQRNALLNVESQRDGLLNEVGPQGNPPSASRRGGSNVRLIWLYRYGPARCVSRSPLSNASP